MTPTRSLIVALSLTIGMASTATAQVNPFGRSLGTTFTEADLKLLQEGTAALRGDGVKVGDETAWDNPASGNRGRSKVIDMPTIDGLPCRKIVHQVRLKGRSDPQYVSIITCKTASGEWRNAF